MDEKYRGKIGKFLRTYIDISPGCSYSDEDIIRQGLRELVKHNVFTVVELQKAILRSADIILPTGFIQECAEIRYMQTLGER